MSLIAPHQRQGTLLVGLQFFLLLVLGLMAAPSVLGRPWPLVSLLLMALSVVMAGWTLAHNRLGNFNIRPAPKIGGRLITSGPYRYIRHPMYTVVLMGAASLATLAGTLLIWLVWGGLVVVLWLKSHLEEQWLRELHPQYATYCGASKRFIPWLV